MGKRGLNAFYPTDPHAVEALRLWLLRCFGYVPSFWTDPAAGYGGLLQRLCPYEGRCAFELEPKFEPLLTERAPLVSIGDGRDYTQWPRNYNVVINPPFSHKLVCDFIEAALYFRKSNPTRIVAVLVLTTWVRSQSAPKLFAKLGAPSFILGHMFRLTCDDTGKSDPRTHEWLVWMPGQEAATRFELLPKPRLSRTEVALHRLMARSVEALFAPEN